jgi:hypothetical protein
VRGTGPVGLQCVYRTQQCCWSWGSLPGARAVAVAAATHNPTFQTSFYCGHCLTIKQSLNLACTLQALKLHTLCVQAGPQSRDSDRRRADLSALAHLYSPIPFNKPICCAHLATATCDHLLAFCRASSPCCKPLLSSERVDYSCLHNKHSSCRWHAASHDRGHPH